MNKIPRPLLILLLVATGLFTTGSLRATDVPAESAQFEWLQEGEIPSAGYPEDSRRSLQVYYDRRPFAGGAPWVPHALPPEGYRTDSTCLACHEKGGVYAWEAWAPTTPHPERGGCAWCHQDGSLVDPDPARWETNPPPAINQQKTPWEPPAIPHPIAGRERCVTCHSGPGAVIELRTPHPERAHCRQCHLTR